MTPREIIAKAWAITKQERTMRSWGFAAALLETLLNTKLLIYQSWFAYSYFVLNEPIGFFQMEEVLLHIFPFGVAVGIIITLLVLVVIEWFFPHFAQGAVIGLAAKSHMKQEVKGGLVMAIYNFFPIFVIHELAVLSSLTTCITIASLMVRYGPDGDFLMLPLSLLAFFWFFSNVLKFIASFSEEAVVIDKCGVFQAMGRSIKIIISHLTHVLFLFILMFVITLRILINLVLVLVIPGIVVGVGFLLTQFLPQTLSYSIGAGFGVILIVIASYFFAYITIFRQTVWTITYLELNKLRDLDIITEEAAGNATA